MLREYYMNHLYIAGTILFTVYGQVALKWRIAQFGALPIDNKEKLMFMMQLLLDPVVITALLSAFVASLCWMMAMTKFDMSYAYPFIGATYALNLLFAVALLHEPFAWNKLIGNTVILVGIIIASRTV